LKTRRCKLCRTKVPADEAIITRIHAFCCFEHLIEYSKTEAARRVGEKAKRKAFKEAKKRLQTRADVLKTAQKAFNEYIRVRDKGKACVSCGALQGVLVQGGAFDAGHYRSVGSAPHLRFHLWNCHTQCVKCNRYLSGNVVEYRKGLIKRIGIEKVEMLENINATRKYTKDDLERITKLAKKRTKKITPPRQK